MFKILKSSVSSICNKNFELFYQNNGKLRMIKEKFNSILLKHNLEIPEKIFISPINKKKKLDLNNNFDLGLSNINQAFIELFKVFELIVKIGEGADKIFTPLLDKLFGTNDSKSNNQVNSSLNLINNNDSKYDNLSLNHQYSTNTLTISIKHLIIDTFISLINQDKFIKYTLLAVKSKGIKQDEILLMEKLINESDNQFIRAEKVINIEVKHIFEKIVNNTVNFKKELSVPITPDNSEESDFPIENGPFQSKNDPKFKNNISSKHPKLTKIDNGKLNNKIKYFLYLIFKKYFCIRKHQKKI